MRVGSTQSTSTLKCNASVAQVLACSWRGGAAGKGACGARQTAWRVAFGSLLQHSNRCAERRRRRAAKTPPLQQP